MVSSEFTAEHARLFEDGVDFIASLAGLEGKWRDDWDKDLQGRIGAADLVAVVSVRTLRTDTNLDRRLTHRLFVAPERVLIGSVPADEEVQLAVQQGSGGFAGVHSNLARLQTERFVAFVKYYDDGAGGIGAHWHLSPASEDVIRETEGVVAMRQQDRDVASGTVKVHVNR